MKLQLSFEKNPHPDDIQVIGDGIMAYANQEKGFQPLDFFAFFIRDPNHLIMGGCNGSTLYGCLYIDQLWVNDHIRNQGWGTKLIEAALHYGKEKGCTFAAVNTMDWEALGFYQKLGFKLEFERQGFQKNSVFYFLRKDSLESVISNQGQEAIKIRSFTKKDIDVLVNEFSKHNWLKPKSTFEQYWQEQTNNERLIWLALYKEQLAGYVTLKWDSFYTPFLDRNIPEIMDLNVLPPYRNKGIGSLLLCTAENEASTRNNSVGLGVGLYKDYGNAQQLYIRKGYIPDGLGITYQYKSVEPGANIPLDDDLILWLTKKLK